MSQPNDPNDANPTTRIPTPGGDPWPDAAPAAPQDSAGPQDPAALPDAEPSATGWPGSTDEATPPPAQDPVFEAAAGPPPASPPADASTWSVPPPSRAWQPPAADHGRTASILFGLVMLGVGLWFFADTTLGLDLPRIRWGQLWPVGLILLGLWIAFGSLRRRSR
jgi:hypothetical protein